MQRQLRPSKSIQHTWYGSGVVGRVPSPGALVPNMPRPAWVQTVHRRDHWLTAVRKPEHAPAGSTVALVRRRGL
jgi:hypothetical protein